MSRARAVTRTAGELLITAGLVILLFCVYQLFWTNVEADREAAHITDEVRHEWVAPAPATSPTRPASIPMGAGIALLHVPRLGQGWVRPIVQGVGLDDLARGVGHYPETVLPGEVGNFAVAGHRATHGEPFKYIDALRRGDKVVVETRTEWFTYVVDSHRIVEPADTWVLQPVPGKPAATPTQRLITLTSCEPRWASYHRWIVFGHLESAMQKTSGGTLPPALASGS